MFEKVGIEHFIIESVEQGQQVWMLKYYGATVNIGPNVLFEDVDRVSSIVHWPHTRCDNRSTSASSTTSPRPGPVGMTT